MIEIAAAISMATSTFTALKRGMEAGRDIEDMVGYYSKWFEAKESLSEGVVTHSNQPLVKRLFSGSSVEAQALEITAAKHKMERMEKELREYLIYTGQSEFYNDMMRERRAIRSQRLALARERAARKRLIIDCCAGGVLIAVGVFIVVGMIALVAG